MTVVGAVEFEIRPLFSGFEAQLRSQLQPIIARVESQLGPAFARAGTAAAQSFAKDFSRTLGAQVGAAVQGAAGGRQISDAGRQAAEQFGRGLVAEAEPQVSKGLSGGISKATDKIAGPIRAAGEQSGRVFGSGFGEGFAALAAFAIATRIGRFFRQTVEEAGAFSDAIAGVRKNVEGTPAEFGALETRVKSMAEQFGKSATEIAGVADVAGKLGTPISQLSNVTETAVKAGIGLDISAQAAAEGLTVFARLTKTPLEQVSNLGSALAQLDAEFAGTAPRILEFATRAAAGLTRLGFTGPQILAVGAAFQEAGVRTDSGSRAVITAVTAIQRAAAGTGQGLQALLQITRLGADEFKALAASDPGALFVRFLRGISTAGAELTPVLKEIGLDAERLTQNLGVGASQFQRLADGIDSSSRAFEENTRLARELSIRQESNADRLRRVEEAFRNTRIEIGSKLAPVLIGILKPLSELSTGTTAVIASFAGLAAAGFAFVRFSNIIREFSKTLGAGALTAREFTTAMRISQQQGVSLATTLRAITASKLTLAEADARLAAGDTELTARFARQQASTLGIVGAIRQARTELAALNIAQSEGAFAATKAGLALQTEGISATAAATALRSLAIQTSGATAATALTIGQAQTALRATGAGSRALAESLALVNTSAAGARVGILATGQAAFTAAGGFSTLLSAVGKLSIFLLIADFATQAARGVQNFFDQALRGKQDIDATSIALQKFAIGGGSINDVFDKARLSVGGFSSFGVQALDTFGNAAVSGFGPILTLTRTIQDTGIPVISQLTGAIATVSSTVLDVANVVPFLGRVVTTESERAKKSFEDLNQGLIRLLEQAGPKVAGTVFKELSTKLKEQGVEQADLNKGLEEFRTKLRNATEGQKVFGADAETARARLQAMGLTAEEVEAALQAMGIQGTEGLSGIAGGAEAAGDALRRLTEAQAALQSRVQALIQPVSGLIDAQRKLAKAGGGAGRDTLRSARAIEDAERALAEAREDANDRIADAQRRLSDAETEAARRVLDAQRKLEESRIQSGRRLRDAGQDLADFENALQRVGGAVTPEDIIRLRELGEAVADATQDARAQEIEGQRALDEARREGADKVEEAVRRLAEVQEEAAEKIEDALRRLARAQEDAANRTEAAAARMGEAISLSTAQIRSGFQDQANQLTTFATLMSKASDLIFASFGDRNLSEAFLADLNELGVDAIPILRNLVNSSDTELRGLGEAFEKQIKAAKKAADFQFDRFPPNFQQAIKPAVGAIVIELEKLIGNFDLVGANSADMAEIVGTDLQKLTGEFLKLAAGAGANLNSVITDMLTLAQNTTDPIERVRILKELIEGIRSGNIPLTIDFAADTTDLEKNLRKFLSELDQSFKELGIEGITFAKFGKTVRGPLAQLPRAQFGSTAAAGQPILVGRHTAEELFVPSTAGAIFKHTDTERILRALRVARTGQVVNNVIVNQVAEDPLATARAVSFQIGSGGAIR